MARAHFVKKARKTIRGTGIRKGQSYWWWKFRFGAKHVSKIRPRPSQLTRSSFYSTLLSAQEQVEDLKPDTYETVADLESDIESIKSELENLRDETQGNFENMPDSLQQGDTGQLLENRVSELDGLIGEFEGLDYSEPDDDESTVADRVRELMDEISGFNWSID